jgi:hypothetical protein
MLFLAACETATVMETFPQPKTLTDTTGLTFGWSSTHAVTPPAGAPQVACTSGTPGYSWGGAVDALVTICGGCNQSGGSFQADARDCRPIVCTLNADCPILFSTSFACIHGLCQSGSAVSATDLVALCLADIPRDQNDTPLAMQRYDEVTTSGTTVPGDCRQP